MDTIQVVVGVVSLNALINLYAIVQCNYIKGKLESMCKRFDTIEKNVDNRVKSVEDRLSIIEQSMLRDWK